MSKIIRFRSVLYTAIASLVATFPILVNCQTAHPKSAQKATKAPDPLYDEARSVARDLLNSSMAHCGDSYYWRRFEGESNASTFSTHMFGGGRGQSDTFYQFRNVSFMIQTTQLTQAQKLNGMEWDGYAYLKFNVYRKSAPVNSVDQSIQTAVWGSWTDAAFDIDTQGRLWNTDKNGNFIVHVTVYTDDDDGSTHTSRSNEPFSEGRVLRITKQNGQWIVDGKPLPEAKSAMVGFYWSPTEAMCRDIPGESREASKQSNARPLDKFLAIAGIEGQADSFAYGQLSSSFSTFLKLRPEKTVPETAVVVYHQGDKRLQGLDKPATFRGFGIYLVAEKEVPTYDPGPILFLTSSPGGAWSDPARANYKSGHATGHLDTGTVCHLLYGLHDFMGANGKATWPMWAPVQSDGYFEAQCFEKGKSIYTPSLRVINIGSPGLAYLKDASIWVKDHSTPSTETPSAKSSDSTPKPDSTSVPSIAPALSNAPAHASALDDALDSFRQYVGVTSIQKCAQKVGASGETYAVKIITRPSAVYYGKLEGAPGSEHFTQKQSIPEGLQLNVYLSTNKVGQYWYQAYDEYVHFGSGGGATKLAIPLSPQNQKTVYFDEVSAGTEDILVTSSRKAAERRQSGAMPKHWPISGYIPVESIGFCADAQNGIASSRYESTNTSSAGSSGVNPTALRNALQGKLVYPIMKTASTGVTSHRLITANGVEQLPPVMTIVTMGGDFEYSAGKGAYGAVVDQFVPFPFGVGLSVTNISFGDEYVDVEVAYLQNGVPAGGFDPGHVRIMLGGGWQSNMTTERVLAQITRYLPEKDNAGAEGTVALAPAHVTWTDNRFGSKWMTTDNGKDVTFQEARQYCSSLPNSERFKTWHLPKTIVGVSWIVDYSVKPIHIRREFHLDSSLVWVSSGFQDEIPQIFDFSKGSIVQEHAAPDAKARALCINEVGK